MSRTLVLGMLLMVCGCQQVPSLFVDRCLWALDFEDNRTIIREEYDTELEELCEEIAALQVARRD